MLKVSKEIFLPVYLIIVQINSFKNEKRNTKINFRTWKGKTVSVRRHSLCRKPSSTIHNGDKEKLLKAGWLRHRATGQIYSLLWLVNWMEQKGWISVGSCLPRLALIPNYFILAYLLWFRNWKILWSCASCRGAQKRRSKISSHIKRIESLLSLAVKTRKPLTTIHYRLRSQFASFHALDERLMTRKRQ